VTPSPRTRSVLAILVFLFFGPPSSLGGQTPTGRLSGTISDVDSRLPLEGVMVRIEGTRLVAFTDTLGRFDFPSAPAGRHMVRAERLGYATNRVAVMIPSGGTIRKDIPMSVTALRVEGITVVADPVAKPKTGLGTASVIERTAIRHQTATTLGDVLQLSPGVEFSAPGLGAIEQIALRSTPTTGTTSSVLGRSASDLAAFGTLVVVDGIPLSNNGNLQTLGNRGELFLTTSAGGGIDLRKVPASTIERVEVIRGIPSVRYGDLTHGAVVVETRTGEFEAEVLGRLSANNHEVSASNGTTFSDGRHATTLFLDWARTKTQPGVSDDAARRLTVQAGHRFIPGSGVDNTDRLVFDSRLVFFTLTDDRPENPNVRFNRSSSSKDRGIRLLERIDLELSPETNLHVMGSFSRTYQRSSSSAELIRSALPFTNRTEEGRQEGFFVIGPYVADVEVEGVPSTFFGRLEVRHERRGRRWHHDLLGGLELRREWTPGEGVQFDMERPAQSSFNGVEGYDRPRAFDEIPGISSSAVYVEDRLRLAIGDESLLQVQGGVRVDLLHDGRSWFSGLRDVVLAPRINLEWTPVPSVRLRTGFGRLAKLPAISDLYPAPQYYDVVNVNQLTPDPAEQLAVLTTFIRDPENPDLGFSQGTKLEAGFEASVGESFLSVSVFEDRIRGAVAIRPEPSFLLRDHFQLTDSIIGNGIKPEIVLPPSSSDTVPILIDRPGNYVRQDNVGIEAIVAFQEIRALRTRLHLTGSWVKTRMEAPATFFGPADRFSGFQIQTAQTRVPYWVGAAETGEKVLASYRLIHQQPSIGLVVTAAVQHNIYDKVVDETATDTLAFEGYVTRDGRLVPVPEEERGNPEYSDLRRSRGGYLLETGGTPGDWMMSLQVSKSLPFGGTLNFWAFNVLDNRGLFATIKHQSRFFSPMQFGLEVNLAPGAFLGGGP